MKFRVKQYKKGWIVEYRKRYLFFTKWIPVTTYMGMKDPFYYTEPERARDGALEQIKHDINYSFYYG